MMPPLAYNIIKGHYKLKHGKSDATQIHTWSETITIFADSINNFKSDKTK